MPHTSKLLNAEFFGLKTWYFQILDSLAERAARRDRYRKMVMELQALSNRELADFGFHRTEIPQVARKAAALD